MQIIRWGIWGTGGIARVFAEELALIPTARVQAVGSRTAEKASLFAKDFHVKNQHASCQSLAEDPEVDVIYIASPHSGHYAEMLACLRAGKAVLCEKAFTLNARQAEEAVALAKANNLFLMEAMWTRFFPVMGVVRDWVHSGRIGEITRIEASFCGKLNYDPLHRAFNPELGGGALLDLGVYPIALATMLLEGYPVEISGTAERAPSGVDQDDELTLRFASGAVAHLSCATVRRRMRTARIIGEWGEIQIPHEWYHPARAELRMERRRMDSCRTKFAGRGYFYEALEVMRLLREGRKESPVMPLADTLKNMRIMDALRAQWGLRYPGE